ncbi:hypothetical protein [Streptomyces sp. 8N616]|uniref:hypothetical protein n=1 Tax=Streptomyces sp. 8N616 TaxID=3457414 RepID=UPI003FD00CA5
MSRETDSSSSGPQGRGGAAYPSGTPPYGTRQYPSLHPPQDAARENSRAADNGADDGEAPKPEEPRTETTLTTRIRINIPGSRPIPPVVVRKPVEEGDAEAAAATGPTSSTTGTSPAASPTLSVPAPKDEQQQARSRGSGEGREEPKATSDWFAPRKAPTSTPASAPTPPTPLAAPAPRGAGERKRSDMPYFSNGSGAGPASGHGSGPGAGPGESTGGTPAYGTGRPDSGPYAGRPGSDPGTGPTPPYGRGPGPGPAGPTASAGAGPAGPAGPTGAGPAGPTTGPMTGDLPVPPPGFRRPEGPGGPGLGDDTARLTPQAPSPTDGDHRSPASGIGAVGAAPGGPASGGQLPSGLAGPGGPGGPGSPAGPPGPGGPARPGGPSGPSGPEGPDHISGDTLVSGVSRVPSSGDFAFPGSPAAGDRAFPPGPPIGEAAEPRPAPAPAASSPAPAPPGKKGRSKLVLAGAGLVGVAVVAYGAGLLLDHADVPNGTTVLGVDIGGLSKEDAVARLDDALGGRVNGPLTVAVDGKEEQLKPSAAGLTLDTETTVRGVAGRDYNPVSVIGSLFGGAREGEPEIEIDEEKLAAALKTLSGEVGGNQDGTIKFVPGKAVAVPGKTHKAVDVEEAVAAVEDAYWERAETGQSETVELPVSMQKPTISRAEIDRKMKEFAEPAMSGLVTIKAGGKSIPFGPDKSLPKVLSVKPVNGRLVEVYDREALKKLYGSTFDGVLITKGDGSRKPVSPEDVAAALAKALRGKTPAERIGVIPLEPS